MIASSKSNQWELTALNHHRTISAYYVRKVAGGYDPSEGEWALREELPFSAAVFAGGASTRMGTDKAFLRIGDELLIERQIRCLREAGAAQVLISGRLGVDYSRFGLTVVHDERSDCGPLAGLAAILKSTAFETALVLAVDMPAMTPTMLRKIVSRCGHNLGCVPVDDRGFEPLAAAYSKQLLPLAEELLAAGSYSMREFVTEAVERALVRALELESAEQLCFVNCNWPSDWAHFSS
jgi:molybdopterin-guanine dinucleotide biosynthesis protein A